LSVEPVWVRSVIRSATPMEGVSSVAPETGTTETFFFFPSKYLRVRFGKAVAMRAPDGILATEVIPDCSGAATTSLQ